MKRALLFVVLAVCGVAQTPLVGPIAGGGGGGAGTVTSVGLVGTSNQITVTGTSPITSSGSWTLSIPTSPTLPGTTTGTFSGNLTGNVTGNASTATALAANGTNCTANSAAGGVDASGNAEDCTAYVLNTRNVNTTSPLGGGGALSADLTLTCTTCLTGNQTITLTGDTTGSGATSIATTTSKINGTSFAGTSGDVVSFGASNIPADSGFLATNVVRKDTTNTAAAAFTLNLTTNQGAQLLYGPQAPHVSDTDGICAAAAGTPPCPSGSILVSGTNQASFATNIAMPANSLAANRVLMVYYGYDIGAAATIPTAQLRLLACPTANLTVGNATACSAGGATLWTSLNTAKGTAAAITGGGLSFSIQGGGSNTLYTTMLASTGLGGTPVAGSVTKASFTTSAAWTLYMTVTYSAATAGNWLLQASVVPSYIN